MVLHVSTDSLADYEYSRRPLVALVATGSADWPVVVLPFRAWAGSGFALPRPFVAIFLVPFRGVKALGGLSIE